MSNLKSSAKFMLGRDSASDKMSYLSLKNGIPLMPIAFSSGANRLNFN